MPSFQTVRQPVPTGGWVTATPSDLLDKDKSPFLQNVRFRFGAVFPQPGRATMGDPVDALPMNVARFSVDDQTKWLLLLTDTGLWKWGDTKPGTPPNWVKVSGPVLPGKGRWSWTTGEDCFFFARDGSGGIWRWTGTGAYAKLPNKYTGDGTKQPPPEQVRFVEYFNNRLLAGSVVDVGVRWSNRVRWPVNGDHTNWNDDGSGYLDFYEPEQEPVQGLKVLGNRCVVLREHSLTDLVATGTLEPVFLSEQRTSNVGTIAPFTVASNGLALFFLGNDANVWAWNGSNLTAIGNPIQNTLEAIVDVGSTTDYLGVVFPFRNEYWLWMGNDQLLVLDLLQGRWMYDVFMHLAAMGDAQLAQRQPTWGEVIGSWGDQTLTWGQFRRNFDMRMIVAYEDFHIVSVAEGLSGLDDKSTFSCEVQTPDLYFQPDAGPNTMGTVIKTMLVYEFNNDSDPFEISLSGDRGRTWTSQTHTPSMFGYAINSWKMTSNVLRIRIRSVGKHPMFRWTHMVYDYIPGGPYEGLEQNG